MNKKVVVIGAGIAGLTAAYDLQKAGCDVTVLERDSFAGGRMADVNMKGLNVHTGATIIWSFYKDMMDLVREFGIEDHLEDYQSEFTLDTGTHKYPLNITPTPAALLTSPAISLASKARLATLLPDMIASGFKTDPNLLHTAVDFDDGENIAEYITRKVGRDFLENYIAPLFRIPWLWSPEEISKAYLLSIFGHLTTARTMIFRKGIGELSRVIAAELDVVYGADVLTIKESPAGGVEVDCVVGGAKRTIRADIAVCATQGTKVSAIVPRLRDDPFFSSIRYNRCACVYYLLKRKPQALDRWFSREHPSKVQFFAQIPEDSCTPDGFQKPHLYCELTPELTAEIARAGDQGNLRRYVEDDVRKLYPSLDEDVEDVVEQWIEEMLPVIYPGYPRKIDEFLKSMKARPASLYFCGDYLSHSHTGGACASGRMTATIIQSHHNS